MLLIENPEFGEMRGMWNQVLDSLLRRMDESGSSSGSVTLKLAITVNKTIVESLEGKRLANIPQFDYKVTSNMPQTITTKGSLMIGESELICSDGNMSLRRVPAAQMTLQDLEEDDDGLAGSI